MQTTRNTTTTTPLVDGHGGYVAHQPNLLDPKSGAMVFDELSGRLVSVPIAAFAAAVATLIRRGPAALAEPVSNPFEGEPVVKRRRAPKKAKPTPGATLQHTRRGEVLAEAKYMGPGKFAYGKKTYASVSAAANAAAEDLGQKSRSLNGWVFWGLKKR